MNISVVIITKNEEENIARCIKSCQALHAEIVVLDSYSTDNTKKIAEDLGARVIEVDWQGYGTTKNNGALRAKNDWILSLDADEEVSPQLAGSIIDAFKNDHNVIGYWIKRSLILRGKELILGAVRNEQRLRLYNKKHVQWNNNIVHEDLEAIDKNSDYGYGQLNGTLRHYSYKNLQDMRLRLDKYAQLSAQEMHKKNKKVSASKKWFNSTFYFIKNYIFLLGFIDGLAGFQLAFEQAKYVYKKYYYLEKI